MVAERKNQTTVKAAKVLKEPKEPKEPKVPKAKKTTDNLEGGEKKKREKKPKTGYWWGETQKLPSAEELKGDIDENAEGKRVKYKTFVLTTFQKQVIGARDHQQKLAERFETAFAKNKERLAKKEPERVDEILDEKLRRQKEVRVNGFATRGFGAMKALLAQLDANVSLPQKSVLTLCTAVLKMLTDVLSSAKVPVVVKKGVTLTPVIVSSVIREWIDREYPDLIKFDQMGIPMVVFPSEDEIDKARVLPAEDNIRQMIKSELEIACVSKDSVLFVQRTYTALVQAITELAYEHMLLKKLSKKNKAASKAENSSDSEEEAGGNADEDSQQKKRKKGSFLMVSHIIAILEIKKIPYNQVKTKSLTYERKPRAPPKKKKAAADSDSLPKKKKKTDSTPAEEEEEEMATKKDKKIKKVSDAVDTSHTKKKKTESSKDELEHPQLSIRKPKKHDIADEETQAEPPILKKPSASSRAQEEDSESSEEDQTTDSKIVQSQASGPGDSDEDME